MKHWGIREKECHFHHLAFQPASENSWKGNRQEDAIDADITGLFQPIFTNCTVIRLSHPSFVLVL